MTMPPTHPKRSRQHSPTSGLSWNETIITTPSQFLSTQPYHLLHKHVGASPPLYSTAKNGVDALEAMAMRCLLKHLHLLEQESLENVPEILLRRVWGMVEKR
jgi:hypothetical protein